MWEGGSISARSAGRPSRPTAEGKVWLCAIMDVFSNRIVWYSTSDRITSRITVNALTARCSDAVR
ncbi:hypothetical protein CBZ_14360 [Cellulomonas biazotea]|uniref:Integrase catalytic domain-containing protein n=1 Tax=Cellulomonas biazotea TaxID=1709 RepID=A0A402DQG5_9CELL|nr:hypothetical protein CBZ_14360 [Cellulomonas biazotea]